MAAFPIGAHLISPRRGYVHHGVYAGGGRVVHYAGFNRAFRRGPAEEVSLERFTRGRGLAQVPAVSTKYAGAAAVERARSRIGEDGYRLWSNNCEHFANWCLSGAAAASRSRPCVRDCSAPSRWPARGCVHVLAGRCLRLQQVCRSAASGRFN